MTIGARQIGTRTLGDGTANSGYQEPPATVSLTVQVLQTATVPVTVAQAALTVQVNQAVSGGTRTTGANAALTVNVGLVASIPAKGVKRSVMLVDVNHQLIEEGSLADVEHEDITWRHNSPDSWAFVANKDHPKAKKISQKFQLAQLWRGDMLLTGGPITRPEQDSANGKIRANGKDPLWILGRRHVGRANRTNYVTNGSFENGLAGWGTGIRSPVEPLAGRDPSFILTTVSSERSVNGRYSARQEQTNATYPKYGANLYQQFDWTVDAAAKSGDVWTAAAFAYVPSATLTDISGAALIISRFSTTQFENVTSEDGAVTTSVPVLIEEVVQPLTGDFPLDKWVRIEADLALPLTGATETVVIQLCSPKGVIFWDKASLTLNERLEWYGADQTSVIAKELVEHAQSATFGKSNFNLLTNCPPSGILRDRTFYFSEHVNILQTLNDFNALSDGFDHRVDQTPTSWTYVTNYPARGRWMPRSSLEFRKNFFEYQWLFDGESAANSEVLLGEGSGSDREEGYAIDTSIYENALTIEEVIAASPETPVESLDKRAEERLEVIKDPQVLQLRTIHNPDRVLGYVRVGDVLPVTLVDGGVDIRGERFRLVEMTLHPDDTLTLTLNPRDVTI